MAEQSCKFARPQAASTRSPLTSHRRPLACGPPICMQSVALVKAAPPVAPARWAPSPPEATSPCHRCVVASSGCNQLRQGQQRPAHHCMPCCALQALLPTWLSPPRVHMQPWLHLAFVMKAQQSATSMWYMATGQCTMRAGSVQSHAAPMHVPSLMGIVALCFVHTKSCASCRSQTMLECAAIVLWLLCSPCAPTAPQA